MEPNPLGRQGSSDKPPPGGGFPPRQEGGSAAVTDGGRFPPPRHQVLPVDWPQKHQQRGAEPLPMKRSLSTPGGGTVIGNDSFPWSPPVASANRALSQVSGLSLSPGEGEAYTPIWSPARCSSTRFTKQDSTSSDEKEGFLTKRTNHIKIWKQRYFVLREGTLYYYKDFGDKETDQPRGVISLDGCFVYDASEKTGKPFCFELQRPSGRNMYMYADAEQQCREWIIALRRLIYANLRSQIGGKVFTWGHPVNQSNEDPTVPALVRSLRSIRITSVACGEAHCIVLTEEGGVYSWGRNVHSQLGLGENCEDIEPNPRPLPFFTNRNIRSVACGVAHTIAVAENGELFSWGRNDYGQLSLADCNNRSSPQLVTFLQNVRVTNGACGSHHTVVRSATGEIYSCGWGQFGQLGHGDTTDLRVLQRVSALHGNRVSLLACGDAHTIVLLRDTGDIYSWGKGTSGQLGHGDAGSNRTPRLLQTMAGRRIVGLDCGENHSVCLTANGEVYAWGTGKHGQLGQSVLVEQWTPRQVCVLDNVKCVKIACGARVTFAVTEDGDVFSWGSGDGGAHGHRSTALQSLPRVIESLIGKAISVLVATGTKVIAMTERASDDVTFSEPVPFDFLCAITGEIMRDPVSASDGQTYDREAIESWLENNTCSPVTGLELETTELQRIVPLMDEIRRFKKFMR